MSDGIILGTDTHEAGVEVWKAKDCIVCDSKNTVTERLWHSEMWCSECETRYEIILRPV